MHPIDFTDTALGLVSTQSFPAIVGIADNMLKCSGVTLVGYEQIGGGHCTAVVRGGVSDVRLAVQTGEEVAAQYGQKASSVVIPRPMPNLEVILPIGAKLAQLVSGRGRSRLNSNYAVGLLETRGFPALVGAADAMLKAADVVLTAYESIGAGLCTIIIRGTVANVAVAVEAGMMEADRIGELHAVMVIPRPLEDLDRTLPLASCWIEEVEPLRLPVAIKEKQRELVVMPELRQLAAPLQERALLELAESQATPLEELELAELQATPLEEVDRPPAAAESARELLEESSD